MALSAGDPGGFDDCSCSLQSPDSSNGTQMLFDCVLCVTTSVCMLVCSCTTSVVSQLVYTSFSRCVQQVFRCAGGAHILHARLGELHQHSSLVYIAGDLQPNPTKQDYPPVHWLEVSQQLFRIVATHPATLTLPGMEDVLLLLPLLRNGSSLVCLHLSSISV